MKERIHNHIVQGEFQSDKYPSTPRGKVPLSVKDRSAQDLLWAYAKRHRMKDAEFSDDLEKCLLDAGYIPATPNSEQLRTIMERITDLPAGALGYITQTTPPYKMDIIPLALHGLRSMVELIEAAEAEKKRRIEAGEYNG